VSISNSIIAHADVKAAMDRALENGRGVLIDCSSEGEAIYTRQCCYSFRKTDRRKNREIYELGHPQHGVSVYDILTFYPALTEDDKWCCVIEVANANRFVGRMRDL